MGRSSRARGPRLDSTGTGSMRGMKGSWKSWRRWRRPWRRWTASPGARKTCNSLSGMASRRRQGGSRRCGTTWRIPSAILIPSSTFWESGWSRRWRRQDQSRTRRSWTRAAKPFHSRQRGPRRTRASDLESRLWVRRRLRKRNQQRRGRKPPKKKRSGWRFRLGKTSKKWRGRNLPERQRNLAVRAQKWCSSNQQREWATLPSCTNLRSASTLTNWAPQSKELGRRAPRTCWLNLHVQKKTEDDWILPLKIL